MEHFRIFSIFKTFCMFSLRFPVHFLRRSAVAGPHSIVQGGKFEYPGDVAWSTSLHIVARPDGCCRCPGSLCVVVRLSCGGGSVTIHFRLRIS